MDMRERSITASDRKADRCVRSPMKPEEQALKSLRILAVDDDESNLLLLRRMLERAATPKSR
jgi:PleD family two-component response regulator